MARKKKSAENGWMFLAWLAVMLLGSALAARAGVLEDVRNQFNRDKGAPRLVVLVSPT
jgi:hypothetical protein